MASSPTQIQAHFRRAVTPDVIHGLAKCVWAAYPEAHRICATHLLRDQVHGQVRSVFGAVHAGLTATAARQTQTDELEVRFFPRGGPHPSCLGLE